MMGPALGFEAGSGVLISSWSTAPIRRSRVILGVRTGGVSMKLRFIYQPVADLGEAVAFHRDDLGFDEAWREGEDTVAFWLPDRSAQVMLSTTEQPAGPMYLVDDLDAWMLEHSGVGTSVARYEIPGGSVAGFSAPGGNIFYVYDQPHA
jgi:hypothetical protein